MGRCNGKQEGHGLPKALDDLLNNSGGNLIYQDYVMQHEMAVAKQQSEAWRKALDGVSDSLRMLLEINNTENVPEYSEKQKKQYNDAIKAYDHTGNGVSWSQFEWKTYDTQMTVTFEDSVKVESISKGMNVINGQMQW